MKIDFEQFKKQFMQLPLGLRLNNPGCIRASYPKKWIGEVNKYQGFACFDSIEHGIRAMVMVLMRYIYIYRIFDIKTILHRYAPKDDGNSPDIYANIVCKETGFYFIPEKIGELREVLPLLIYRMTCVENGKEYYIKSIQTQGFTEYFFSLVKEYIDEYLNDVVYPVHGKKETI